MTRTPEHTTFRLNEILAARPELAPVLMDIALELLRAEGIHPRWDSDAAHALGFLSEEAGELAKAVNDFHSSGGAHAHRVSMGDEATQAGAMAVRFLLNLHRFQAPKECAA